MCEQGTLVVAFHTSSVHKTMYQGDEWHVASPLPKGCSHRVSNFHEKRPFLSHCPLALWFSRQEGDLESTATFGQYGCHPSQRSLHGDQCWISHCLSVWSPEPTPGNWTCWPWAGPWWACYLATQAYRDHVESYLSTTQPPCDTEKAVSSGLLGLPLLGTTTRVAADWCRAWSLLGNGLGHISGPWDGCVASAWTFTRNPWWVPRQTTQLS